MIGGVTRRWLPHLPGIPYINVSGPLVRGLFRATDVKWRLVTFVLLCIFLGQLGPIRLHSNLAWELTQLLTRVFYVFFSDLSLEQKGIKIPKYWKAVHGKLWFQYGYQVTTAVIPKLKVCLKTWVHMRPKSMFSTYRWGKIEESKWEMFWNLTVTVHTWYRV